MPGLGGMNASIWMCWPESKRRDNVAQMVGWCPCGQAEISENFVNHRGIFNHGNIFQGAATVCNVPSCRIETRPSFK